MANKSRYFADAEFQRCSPSCSINDMQQSFLTLLDKIRAKAGIPMVLTSAYRSKEYDKSKGRSGNSAHTKGLAVDVKAMDSATRFKIVFAAREMGIRRIGIGKTFVHIDADPTLPQDVVWDYYTE